MKLDGVGIFVKDMKAMVDFYCDVLKFEIDWDGKEPIVMLTKDNTLFMFYGRNDFEKMTSRKYEYIKGINPHYEITLSVDNFSQVDEAFHEIIKGGGVSVLEPVTKPSGIRTCYIADPEDNLIEIRSINEK